MTASKTREQLLGAGRREPPERIRRRALFSTAEDRSRFLAGTHSEPLRYWGDLADEIPWMTEPASVGGPGNWFPGGQLNLSALCLDGALDRYGDTEAALAVVREHSAEPIELSRCELARTVGGLCRCLEAWGLAPGARVLLAIPRGAVLVVATLACWRLGLTCVPHDPTAGDPGQIARRAAAAECSAALVHPRTLGGTFDPRDLPVAHRLEIEVGWEMCRDDLPPARPVDAMHPALMIAESSGRMHALPTAGLALQALSAHRHLLTGRVGEEELYWVQTPPQHASTTTALLGVLGWGNRLVMPSASALDTESGLRAALAELRPQAALIHAAVFAAMRHPLAEMPASPPATGPPLIAIEGAEVPPNLFEYVRRALAPASAQVVQVTARPEIGGFAAGPDPCVCPVLPASVGPPAPGVPLVVVDQQGKVCPSAYGGFAALLRAIPSLALDLQSQELPVRLGFRARVDREGYFWPVGETGPECSDDESVSVQEIEAMVASLPEVDQVAVVHYSTPARVPGIAMFVKPDEGADELEQLIVDAVRERFGDDAVPRLVQFVDELPVSRTGKLLRSVLRQIAEGDAEGLPGDEIAANSAMIHRIVEKL